LEQSSDQRAEQDPTPTDESQMQVGDHCPKSVTTIAGFVKGNTSYGVGTDSRDEKLGANLPGGGGRVKVEAGAHGAHYLDATDDALSWIRVSSRKSFGCRMGGLGKEDLRRIARNETELVNRSIGKHGIGIVFKPAKRLGSEQPSEKGILVAHSVGNRVDCDHARTLCEV